MNTYAIKSIIAAILSFFMIGGDEYEIEVEESVNAPAIISEWQYASPAVTESAQNDFAIRAEYIKNSSGESLQEAFGHYYSENFPTQAYEEATEFDIETAKVLYGDQLDDELLDAMAKMLWGEARGIESQDEKAAVVWTAVNRYDAGYGDTIYSIVTDHDSFHGYYRENPVWSELRDLSEDVLLRYYAEKDGAENVGRVLPSEYCWFRSDKHGHNVFRNKWKGSYDLWDWSLESPYENAALEGVAK